MWGNSSGPVFDRSNLPKAELALKTTNASVRAFIDGRPQHFDQDDLRPENARSARWKSFLSVPILVRFGDARISVGVVTLASSSSRRDSALPLEKTKQMQQLIDQMITVGRSLLNA